MKRRHEFYTRTLAELYLSQGYLDDAESAYRFLIEKEPKEPGHKVALEEITRMRRASGNEELIDLMTLWAFLLRQRKKRLES